MVDRAQKPGRCWLSSLSVWVGPVFLFNCLIQNCLNQFCYFQAILPTSFWSLQRVENIFKWIPLERSIFKINLHDPRTLTNMYSISRKVTGFNKQKSSIDKETKGNIKCMWAPKRNPCLEEWFFSWVRGYRSSKPHWNPANKACTQRCLIYCSTWPGLMWKWLFLEHVFILIAHHNARLNVRKI